MTTPIITQAKNCVENILPLLLHKNNNSCNKDHETLGYKI